MILISLSHIPHIPISYPSYPLSHISYIPILISSNLKCHILKSPISCHIIPITDTSFLHTKTLLVHNPNRKRLTGC